MSKYVFQTQYGVSIIIFFNKLLISTLLISSILWTLTYVYIQLIDTIKILCPTDSGFVKNYLVVSSLLIVK